MTSTALPPPPDDAQAHSDAFSKVLKDFIREQHGAIPFSRFMELALYAPGMGYYSAGAHKFGADGDFITAPELGPVFAHCVARFAAKVFAQLSGDKVFFEIGGGSGAFAEHCLQALHANHTLPDHYWILEPSADLRERQMQRLQQTLPADVFARCAWLDGPPEHEWNGVLFANEVIDALPTSRFVIRSGEVFEEFVALDNQQQFMVVDQPADAMLHAAVRHVERDIEHPLAENYRSEILPQLPYWVQAVGGLLKNGSMLFIDYGYPRAEFYSNERSDGSLICYYRHRAHSNPFFLPGLQDITAFVDFTALAEAGIHAGFDLAGYCSQASFLMSNELHRAMQSVDANDAAATYARSQEIKRLTLPGEMGERFQAIAFQRGVDVREAFAVGDLRRRL
jgi:SAM-dependent MidA family methyltransferase